MDLFASTSYIFDWIEIWGIQRQIQQIKLVVLCLKSIPETLLLCGTMYYPAETFNNHQGILYPLKGVYIKVFQADHCLENNIVSVGLPFSHGGSWCDVFPR